MPQDRREVPEAMKTAQRLNFSPPANKKSPFSFSPREQKALDALAVHYRFGSKISPPVVKPEAAKIRTPQPKKALYTFPRRQMIAFYGLHRVHSVKFYDQLISLLIAEVTRG